MKEPKRLSFEESLAELEKLLRTLEDGSATLEESLSAYERGVGLVRQCYADLKVAEDRIREFLGTDDEGKPRFGPFEHSASTEIGAAKAKPRSGSRSTPKEGGLY